ncbi:MAG: restriction endonuclease [bacterium]
MKRAWAIKLGSGGCCVGFCERHKIVGLGWFDVDHTVLANAERSALARHVTDVCKWYETDRQRGNATGQLYRFARNCSTGDYVVYYDPGKKHVRVCRVTSDVRRRDFDLSDKADIWHFRQVEYVGEPIPILDFYAVLKGRLLGPRMSFWELRPFDTVDKIARGESPNLTAVSDPELNLAYRNLRDLVSKRVEALNAEDWEWLAVDYFKAQGAHVDETKIGRNRPIIDAEALFYHGDVGEELWRIQVKRYQDRKVDWPEIERDLEKVGEAKFCYVSAYGFTDTAREQAEENEVKLLDASNFVSFLLSGKLRERIAAKLRLPDWSMLEANIEREEMNT